LEEALDLSFDRLLMMMKTWCLTLREESKLRVFENRVLRKICGPKRDVATERLQKIAQWVAS